MVRDRVERWSVSKPVARSETGIVAAQHYAAAEAGAAVLEKGGNAVDAAVVAGFLLQAVEPWMSGIAACGYMLVAEPGGAVHAVEFTGRAPSRLDLAAYAPDPGGAKTFLGMPAAVDGANVRGFSAVVVPGAVRGLSLALARFGTLAFDAALRPAIDQARQGLTADWHTTLAIALAETDLRRDPAARTMFLPGDAPPEPGDVLPLAALAATLERLAEAGPDDFYAGRIAERLAADLAAAGSAITPDDLYAYRATAAPAAGEEITGRSVHVAGETSGGRRLLETLRHFDRVFTGGSLDPAFYRAMVEALRRAFAAHGERNRTAADLLRAASTTHVNAVDGEGRMAALTFTLLNRFGARVVSPSTGILLNNGMAWFDLAPDRLNSLRAGAAGRNNMCPVAITDGDGPLAVLGASGGNQIVPALAQVAAMLLHLDLDVETALAAPRLQAGPSAEIVLDSRVGQDVANALSDLGPIRFAERAVYPRPFASPSAVARRGGRFEGMPDTTYPASEAVAARPRPGRGERGAMSAARAPGAEAIAARSIEGVLAVVPPRAPLVPLLFDSPHSGTTIPAGFRPAVSPDLVLISADTHVDALFDFAPDLGAPLLVAHFPRSFLDVNRSLLDMDLALVDGPWPDPVRDSPSARRGMGLIWRFAWGDRPMYDRPLPVAEIRARIDRYWRPYHAALEGLIEAVCARFGRVYHVNCHSMPERGHKLSPDPEGAERPDFVLGDRDGTSCEPDFVALVEDALRGLGYTVAVNRPFKGAELVAAYSDPARGRHSLQIEINRRLYMDERTRARTAGFATLRTQLAELGAAMRSYAVEAASRA